MKKSTLISTLIPPLAFIFVYSFIRLWDIFHDVFIRKDNFILGYIWENFSENILSYLNIVAAIFILITPVSFIYALIMNRILKMVSNAKLVILFSMLLGIFFSLITLFFISLVMNIGFSKLGVWNYFLIGFPALIGLLCGWILLRNHKQIKLHHSV